MRSHSVIEPMEAVSGTVASPTLATRSAQAFPILSTKDVDRLRRFGVVRKHGAQGFLSRAGQAGHGLTVVLKGEVEVFWTDAQGVRHPVVTYRAGSFMGELAQISGRPSLVDAQALSDVEVLVLRPRGLRDLFVAEADLGERIMRALILRRVGLIESNAGGPVIVGAADDSNVIRLQHFLDRNVHPYQRLDPETDAGARILIDRLDANREALPWVVCPDGQLLRNPSNEELARRLGLVRVLDDKRLYDVVVVGAGPAGLATAVYAASEGLDVLTLDSSSFGGQAGASARIENYLGFPTGISGGSLMARAHTQAEKFGVEMAIPAGATSLERDETGGEYGVRVLGGERIRARTVVIACGAQYRRPDLRDLSAFEGKSVHYWASPVEARICANQEVVLVGGGNSAGQAIVFLASRVAKVYTLVRGRGLADSMSRYLVGRIAGLPNVELLFGCTLTALEGAGGVLEAVRWTSKSSDEERRLAVRHLFLFVGAEPNTAWLETSGVQRDQKGFVITGSDDGMSSLETSLPGVFAIGDVRAGSVKRVAAAVGEGAQVVAELHRTLRRPWTPRFNNPQP